MCEATSSAGDYLVGPDGAALLVDPAFERALLLKEKMAELRATQYLRISAQHQSKKCAPRKPGGYDGNNFDWHHPLVS
jgi:hypothetical protein